MADLLQTDPWAGAIWIAAWVSVSILFRRWAGKPIWPKAPDDALVVEEKASAPFAANCLLVAVTPEHLVISPTFPFNLMFLPEVWGLEHYVPLSEIDGATTYRSRTGLNVEVQVRGRTRPIRLKLRQPSAFVRQLGAAALSPARDR